MKQLIIFDLDGVLVDAKIMHFNSLNSALASVGQDIISMQDHLSTYDGLKTREKLQMLTRKKRLPLSSHDLVWERKQENTDKAVSCMSRDERLIDLFKNLKSKKLKIACCSNSIRTTCFKMLTNIGIIEYFDIIISNEDVKNSKPHPEMYWKAMSMLSINPEDTLIIEDSPTGLAAAERSGATVCRVKGPSEVTISKIESKIYNTEIKKAKWRDDNLNILIPMAGLGSRFKSAGYLSPKPLIVVKDKPMIQTVVDNLCLEGKYTFIVQKSHREKYNLDALLGLISNKCNIIDVNGVTDGAACTTLLAKEYINNDNPLVIANSDQYVEWSASEFMYKMQEQNADAGILCFNSTQPKWSFAKVNSNGIVTEVAEKNPISNIATVGIYYWKKGSDYVRYAEEMIKKNKRYNDEFYVCPVFNEAIEDGKEVRVYMAEKMWGLGTPEDLKYYLDNYIIS
jgi:HAD superfamily hydrolase (TIGR01509 family)